MSNLRYVQHADLSPTKCFMCNEPEGPFIDTRIDMLGYGHLWICAASARRSGCARQLARLDGMFDPSDRKDLVDEILDLTERLEKMEAAVKSKNVPISLIEELLQR